MLNLLAWVLAGLTLIALLYRGSGRLLPRPVGIYGKKLRR